MSALEVSGTQALGPAGQLFMTLLHSLLGDQVEVSPDDMWPENYGGFATGKFSL